MGLAPPPSGNPRSAADSVHSMHKQTLVCEQAINMNTSVIIEVFLNEVCQITKLRYVMVRKQVHRLMFCLYVVC